MDPFTIIMSFSSFQFLSLFFLIQYTHLALFRVWFAWNILFPPLINNQSLYFHSWILTVLCFDSVSLNLFFPLFCSGFCWDRSSGHPPFFTIISMQMHPLFFAIQNVWQMFLVNYKFFSNFIFVLISNYWRNFSSDHKCENFWNLDLLNWFITILNFHFMGRINQYTIWLLLKPTCLNVNR